MWLVSTIHYPMNNVGICNHVHMHNYKNLLSTCYVRLIKVTFQHKRGKLAILKNKMIGLAYQEGDWLILYV